MIPIRTLVTGRFWMMLAWMVMLPVSIATAQNNEQPFDPAFSIANYGASNNFSKVMERFNDGRLSPNFVVDSWYGHTVMHLVAPATLEFLHTAVARGGDCRAKNNFGETPLHFAAAQWSLGPGPDTVRILVDCGADVNDQDSRGATPLHAVYLGVEYTGTPIASMVHLGGGRKDIVQALLDRGADPNIRDKEKDTPLLIVSRPPVDWRGNFARQSVALVDKPSYVRQLLGGGADPDIHDGDGGTPLTIILQSSSNSTNYGDDPVKIISILLEHGADPNLRDLDGDTPLIVAAIHEDDIVDETETLLEGGADPCLPNSEGKLPYDLAKKGSRVKRLLFEAGGYFDENLGMCARDAQVVAATENNLNLSQSDRKRIQVCLKRQAFDPGSPDGVFGPRTRKALQDWQLSQGFTGIESVGYLNTGQTETLLGECKVALVPLCADRTEGAQCWKELTNKPGCHIWDNYFYPAQTVTWSGSCDADGVAVGQGTSEWRNSGKVVIYTGQLTDGKLQGHVLVNFQDRGEIVEGGFVGGKPDGYWVYRGSQGEDWFCLQDGERVDGSDCGVVEISERMAVVGSAVLRSGPGDKFESLGSVDGGVAVTATVRMGNRLWVETSDGRAGFVQASKLAESAGRSVGERFSDCSGCPEMVVVPAGSFMMGSPSSEEGRYDNEGPVHRVTIPEPFAVGRYEVTFREWGACVSGGGCSHRPDDEDWGRGDRSVINVSWEDAKEYVAWLSRKTGERYRLLSESEWEYVARAGTTRPFHFGSTISANQANYDWNVERTEPVGSYPANDFGLYDVHGNVWEWVEDCWHYSYDGAPSNGRAWISGSECEYRVLRGGSWYDLPRYLRSAFRGRYRAGNRNSISGFRVARTLAP